MRSPHSPDHFPLHGRGGASSRCDLGRFIHLGYCVLQVLQDPRFVHDELAEATVRAAIADLDAGVTNPELIASAWGVARQSMAAIVERTRNPMAQLVLEQLSSRPAPMRAGDLVLLLSRGFVDLQDRCGLPEWALLGQVVERETKESQGMDLSWFRAHWCFALEAVFDITKTCMCALSYLLLEEMDAVELPWMLSVS